MGIEFEGEGYCDHTNDDYLSTVRKEGATRAEEKRKTLFPHSSNKLLKGLALSIIVPRDGNETYPSEGGFKELKNIYDQSFAQCQCERE